MTKSDSEVIEQFNEYVNMTADELEEWLKSDPSTSSGWNKEDGSGETIGHDSGRKIVEILKANPDKDSSKYTEDQIAHMHKVVSYCARHLAQEAHMKDEKSPEELQETKSYKSLKNWGHDSLKKDGKSGSSGKKAQKEGDDEEKETAPSKGKGKGKASKEEVQEDERREEAARADQESGEEGGIVAGKRKRKERAISAEEVQEDPEYNSEEDDDFAPGDDDEEEEEEGDDDDEDDDDEEEDEDEDEEHDGPAKKKAKTD